jgi:tetratricopeptide (TPR) repeat protein
MAIRIKMNTICIIPVLMTQLLFIAMPLSAEQKTGTVTREAVNSFQQGRFYHDRGDYQRAVKEYDRFMEIAPGRADAHYRRGLAYYSLGELDRAVRDLDQAIEINPTHTEAYNLRGVAYHGLGDPAQAIKNYDKAIKLRANFPEAYNNRGLPMSDSATWRGD